MPSKATSTGIRNHELTDFGALADALVNALGLRLPPVALAFVTQRPPDTDLFEDLVPSACTLWRRGEGRTFFAPAAVHYNCPIGAVTMGFSIPEQQRTHLAEVIARMAGIGYIEPDEARNIPSVSCDKSGIIYGPLRTFPQEPDAVLVWVLSGSAMLLAEATGACRWTPEQQGIAVFGRPSCAAIPVAVQREVVTFSLGCTGMRTFTGIDGDLHLAVLPYPSLADLPQRLEAVARTNTEMALYYAAEKDRFTCGAAL